MGTLAVGWHFPVEISCFQLLMQISFFFHAEMSLFPTPPLPPCLAPPPSLSFQLILPKLLYK